MVNEKRKQWLSDAWHFIVKAGGILLIIFFGLVLVVTGEQALKTGGSSLQREVGVEIISTGLVLWMFHFWRMETSDQMQKDLKVQKALLETELLSVKNQLASNTAQLQQLIDAVSQIPKNTLNQSPSSNPES